MTTRDDGAVRREQQLYVRGLKYLGYDAMTNALLGLASAVVTARVFGAEVIGAYAIITVLTGSLHMFSNLREQGGLVRELTRYQPGGAEAPALLWLTLAFSAAITLIMLAPFGALAALLLSDVFDHPELFGPFAVLACAYLVLDNTAFNFEAPLIAYRDARAVWLAHLAITSTMILGAGACFLLGEDSIWGIVAITVAASAAGLVVRAVALRRLIGLRTTRARLREMRSRLKTIVWFGARQAPLNYTETAIEYADTAVLGATVSLAGVGAYSRAYTLYRRAGQIPLALGRLYFPTLTALLARGELTPALRVYKLSNRYLTLLLLPAATWLAACAPGVLAVFGPDFERAAPALSVLAFVIVLDGYGVTMGGLLTALNRPGLVSIVNVASAAVNVGLCLVLIPRHGLMGAALANAGGWLLNCVALFVLGAREARQPVRTLLEGRYLARLLAACALAALPLLALRSAPVEIVWQLLAAAPAFAAGLLLFRPIPRADSPSVEGVLASAGVRSPRTLRLAGRLHDAIAHGSPA